MDPSGATVERVLSVISHAAEEAIAAGRATVELRRLTELYPDPSYDCPVVVLTPSNAEAASLVVEVQADDLWWVSAGDGPGTELHTSIEKHHGDRYALLARLVAAVVAGRYWHGPGTEQVRRLFRPPLNRMGWRETFETEAGPFSYTHFGREIPSNERRFAPYA